MGTIKAIEDAYTQTKGYIVYDSFQTIMIALVLFLLFTKLWEEYQKNIGSGKRFDIAAYWGQMKIYVLACFIASSSGMIFGLLINFKWKISTHVASSGMMVGGLLSYSFIFNFNPVWWLCFFILLSGMLGTARIIVKQHTLLEVLAGFIVGLFCGVIGILFI